MSELIAGADDEILESVPGNEIIHPLRFFSLPLFFSFGFFARILSL